MEFISVLGSGKVIGNYHWLLQLPLCIQGPPDRTAGVQIMLKNHTFSQILPLQTSSCLLWNHNPVGNNFPQMKSHPPRFGNFASTNTYMQFSRGHDQDIKGIPADFNVKANVGLPSQGRHLSFLPLQTW